ncbi:hypothetical protein DLNHIDIE_03393 [Acidithiobacillus thiooxidans ATCC 19377]|uniref:Uncharacterized protein n=1 Tax=Acidithiobacillus thiooxidans ATCC 19377 TaxID=637390 RepID=A0A543PZ36_ACITH|nr:hypothetical protein DLNHIDIE_03393 [Acidithiobacillus thiooxidans ATCC 19377]
MSLRRAEWLLYKHIINAPHARLLGSILAIIPAFLLAGWLGNQSSRYVPDRRYLLQGIGIVHSIGDFLLIQGQAGQSGKRQKPHTFQDPFCA